MKHFIPAVLAGLTLAFPIAKIQAQPPVAARVAVKPEPDRGRSINASVWTDRKDYRVGEKVRISYRVNTDAYVIIFSTDAEGKTRQIFPNYYDKDNFVRGGRTYTLPNKGYSLEAVPPRGTETITILASKERGRGFGNYQKYGKSNPFPQTGSVDNAVRGIVVNPSVGRNYDKATTQIQIRRKDWDGGGSSNSAFARLRVDSRPGSANVFIDNNYVGTTPLNLSEVRPGRRTVIVHRDGYAPVYKTVNFVRGETSRIDETLRPDNSGWHGGPGWYGW